MEQKIELKPCPFCGGEAKIHTGEEPFLVDKKRFSSVFCKNCQATSRYFNTSKEAIEAWNRRVEKERR